MTKRIQLLADWAVVIFFAGLTASVLGIPFLNSATTPTGGDAASHVLYAWRYAHDLLFSGEILPWMPEVFAGFPFLSYYFPFPFIVIAFLSKVIGFAPAFKWGGFAAAMLLPGLVHGAGRRWFALPWPAAILGALGAFAFLLHEQNSIWGGNLLSTLSGEFAYSYGLLFAVLACFAWSRAATVRGGWIIAALLEAATGFSHGFPLLVVGFSTVVLCADTKNFRRTAWMLLRGHALAFCLLGGWLWPMLEMHGYTIPNDASFPLSRWQDIFPASLRPVFSVGLLSLAVCLRVRNVRALITPLQFRAMQYLAAAAALSCLGFIAGDQIGLANIRFFPMTWLFCAILCGWLAGFVISGLTAYRQVPPSSAPAGHLIPNGEGISPSPVPEGEGGQRPGERIRQGLIRYRTGLAQTLFTLALLLGMCGWLGRNVHAAPDWSFWNHTGLESKPQWHNLSRLFPAMKGSLWSPRLVFEHDPANSDIGSTRTLEALPMFIGRPVLEGLYMESALVGPAVYQLQSEISARPSSPLARFPSGSLDLPFAAEHMRFMHADTVLLRSATAKKGIDDSGLFQKTAEAPPFALYRLRDFSSHLAEVVTIPIKTRPLAGWMEDSFGWFRTRSRFLSYLPVYGAPATLSASQSAPVVREKRLQRDYLHFETAAVGMPHLIKVTWHPRWRLLSAGQLYIAGPGFMLVVPQGKDIILEYGHTTAGLAGMAATVSAACLLLFLWFRRGKAPLPANEATGTTGSILLACYWGAIMLACLWFATQSPEKTYARAFAAFNATRYDDAAVLFGRAFERRRPQAKKEEALFWSARAHELAGHHGEALKRYRHLADSYHGYWVPESLYGCVRLGRDTGQGALVEPYGARLKEEYPQSSWTGKLKELK